MSVENAINVDEAKLRASLDREKLPRHIAVIMDGNGRWAMRQKLPRSTGHRAAMEAVRSVVELCGELEIPVLTLYTFSAENWTRPRWEVNAIMKLLIEQLQKQTPELNEENVRLNIIGDVEGLPPKIVRELNRSVDILKDNTGLLLNLALNYGGRQEIISALHSIITEVKEGSLEVDDIDEDVFSQHLYTSGLPDPDLLIRTGSEMRISNFLLWQLAYTEIYVADVLWPDFRKKDLLLALLSYQKRQRRFGGI
ncbi:isoprenyl transferase [Candidatus Poribacteria bacterium]